MQEIQQWSHIQQQINEQQQVMRSQSIDSNQICILTITEQTN